MAVKLALVVSCIIVAGLISLLCGGGALVISREEKKPWTAGLRSFSATVVVTMTLMVAIIGVVATAV
jgi:hypothetical protein